MQKNNKKVLLNKDIEVIFKHIDILMLKITHFFYRMASLAWCFFSGRGG